VWTAMDELNANDLINKRKQKEKVRFEEYKRMYTRCNAKILEADSIGNNKFVYNVPSFSPNVPGYKLESCVAVIMYKLRKNNFDTRLISPDRIEVSWKIPDFNILLLEEDEDAEEKERIRNESRVTEGRSGRSKSRNENRVVEREDSHGSSSSINSTGSVKMYTPLRKKQTQVHKYKSVSIPGLETETEGESLSSSKLALLEKLRKR